VAARKPRPVATDANAYSRQWFEFFHVGIDEARTRRETKFICQCAPLPDFRRVLDVCCGTGRHARALASHGYSVTGFDRDTEAIAAAREAGGGPQYVIVDVRDYRPRPDAFDVAIVMGQSFGHFDAPTNRDVLGRVAGALRTGGRIVLDLWNPDFFLTHQGTRELATTRGVVREKKHVAGDRLFVDLDYPDLCHEQFEWQLFDAAQMQQLADSIGLSLLWACSGFDETKLPSPGDPRVQFVLERR
jgi:SAM-dependent methyltransferase